MRQDHEGDASEKHSDRGSCKFASSTSRAPSTKKRPAQAERGRDTLGSQGTDAISFCLMHGVWEPQKHYTTTFCLAPFLRHCQQVLDRLHFRSYIFYNAF